ncbi:MAG TPA: hypothetical protein PLY93_10275 [Turneriella sp.]|nr:hypothetical protein [Turneriella sp.]
MKKFFAIVVFLHLHSNQLSAVSLYAGGTLGSSYSTVGNGSVGACISNACYYTGPKWDIFGRNVGRVYLADLYSIKVGFRFY